MANYLLSERYKDAAAVMAGGALEQHIKRLTPKHGVPLTSADKNGLPVPRRAQTLNDELYKAGAYLVGDQKQVTAWLDLRNDAAHANYGKYTDKQVGLLIAGIRDFITRVPA